MSAPLLSVLIPVFEQEALIVRAIESVPLRDDVEILVCDDGSKDRTAAVVELYMDSHPERRVRLTLQDRNRGAGAARNVLLDQARGLYVASLDADDWFDTALLEQAMAELDGTDIVFLTWVTNDGKGITVTPENKDYYTGLSLRLIRREFIGELRCDELRWAEDQSLCRKLDRLPHTEKYTGIPAYRYNYPRRGSLVNLKLRGFDVRMYDNVFYYSHVFKIGGVETFFYEIARKYGDRDITLLYRTGDPDQLRRLSQFIRVKKWNGEKIKCRKAIFGYSFNIQDLDAFEADEYIQIVHADFLALKDRITPKLDRRFTRYIAVSQNNAVTFEQVCGVKCEVCYNPITVDKPRKVLHLISATRLSAEKGFARMQKLAKALDDAGVRYVWTIYTDSTLRIDSPNVVYAGTRLDIRDYVADADYLVQLSDTEGYPYSLLEALCLGTPVIVTDMPSNPDSQVVDGVNAIVLPFDMSVIPVDRIVKGLKKFKYTPRADGWGEILAEGKSTWQEEREKRVTVEAVIRYRDLEVGRIFEKGEVHECSRARGEDLEGMGFVRIL